MSSNFQRKNSSSNAAEGKAFEKEVKYFFYDNYGIELEENHKVILGISSAKFKTCDLGIKDEIIIECKSHSWTETDNIPSAKLTTWNEAMYFFHLAPYHKRKLFIVEKFLSKKREKTLAEYYVSINHHLIPEDVEIWEFDVKERLMNQINTKYRT